MKKSKTVLVSTGEEVTPIEFTGIGEKPWPNKYERVLFHHPNGKHRVQFVRKSKLKNEEA